MRLFAYYVWHSLVNQIRKLFKTWMMIFLAVCLVGGFLIGWVADSLSDAAEEKEPAAAETLAEEAPQALSALDRAALIELIAGGVILALFAYEALGADKNGSRIFLPADVNLLFPSPMRPQAVLMFRLMTQLGMFLLLGLYMLFQLPNLIHNVGLSPWAALGLVVAWALMIVIGKLLQVLLYLLVSARPGCRAWLRRGVYALLLLVAGGYAMSWRRSGEDALSAAFAFFNSRASRYVPFWGWLKGLCGCAAEGDTRGALLCLAATVLGGGLLIWLIWRTRADFYEDAMAKSEETARLLEELQSEKNTALFLRRKKKDRSDRLRRDGLRHGAGANVFFYKALYNRFRFAHLGVFTKKAEACLFAAGAAAALCRFVIGTDGLMPAALTLAALNFVLALGNPLEQDTGMDCFVLIPEDLWAKLCWSLLGCVVNCLLDVLPAMLLAVLLLRAEVLSALGWILFIVSVNLYATCIGAFINLSVPVSAGKTIKQLVQILFLYFGLVPDVALMAAGMVWDRVGMAAVLSALFNVGMGLVFFAFTPRFLEPESRAVRRAAAYPGDAAAAKKAFSRLGFGGLVMLVLHVLLTAAASALMLLRPGLGEVPGIRWLAAFAPLYLIAVPAGLAVMRKVPARAPEQRPMRAGDFAAIAVICVFMMYAGNLVGTLVTALLSSLLASGAENPLLAMAADESPILRILVPVLLAPVVEEFVFRKTLIDRMNVYGQKLAVVTSAWMFALFHGNFSQFFYAFALGLVFGYVYLKTGRLRGSMALHAAINFIGMVLAPALVERAGFLLTEELDLSAAADLALTPARLVLGLYVAGMLALALAGLVLLIVRSRRLGFAPAPLELPPAARFRTVWLNPGMLLFTAACLAVFVGALLG